LKENDILGQFPATEDDNYFIGIVDWQFMEHWISATDSSWHRPLDIYMWRIKGIFYEE